MIATPASPSRLTVAEALRRGADFLAERGIGSARLDAELLLAHTLGLTRLQLYLALERPLSDDERTRARALLARRARREPVAHITGRREFFSLAFEVTAAVMVPRPETELLVETIIALEHAGDLPAGDLLDIGTGSGCIAVALAHALPARRLAATDLSVDALAVARRNAERHGVADRIAFAEGDLAAGLGGPFAAVVSNPPYVAEADRDTLAPEVLAEPEMAVFGGPDGLGVVRWLIAAAPDLLVTGGRLLIEVGVGQAREVERLMLATGALGETAVHRDLAGIERVVVGRRA